MSRSRALFGSIPLLVSTFALAGCGAGVYRPSQVAHFDIDGTKEIDDEDVAKAFEARPQLPPSFTVAYYSFDDERVDDVEAMIRAVDGVERVYRIPPLLTSGRRRHQTANPWDPPEEISVKKLRLLAARAHADVVVVVDAGYEQAAVNPLVALNVLVLPIFFVPWLDRHTESYLEAYVIDTRNGYLYGHVVTEEEGGPGYATIYDDRAVVDEQWATLRTRTGALLRDLVRDERASSVAQSEPGVDRDPGRADADRGLPAGVAGGGEDEDEADRAEGGAADDGG